MKENSRVLTPALESVIGTRAGVEMAEDTSRHLPATAEQKKQIDKLLKKYPDSKDSHEYRDYMENPTRGNANMFIGTKYIMP